MTFAHGIRSRGVCRSVRWGVVLTLAVTASTAHGRQAARDAEPRDVVIQQLMATAVEWNRGSLEGFIAPYAEESTFMTPAGPIGRAAMVERYRQKYFATGRPLQTLRFEQVEARRLGVDHALMTGRFVLTGGGLAEQSGRFTLVWVRSREGWRILHDHSG
jgi:ketosteroid isomerase-like protein